MWSELGRDERAAWGVYKGSAAQPYQTQVDLRGMVTQCSCPSRRYPCKHGLALIAILAEQPDNLPPMPQPEWVADWITGRDDKAARAEKRTQGVVDEAARAKRVEQRESRVTQGLDELELWLRDLVQQGLIQAPSRPYSFWESAAARLVDAQASGAARLVRELGGIAMSGDGWQERLLRSLGKLTLLIQAWRRLEELPEGVQADVRSAVGFTVSQEAVLSSEAVRDAWLVAGQRESLTERLMTRRTWLLGQLSKRAALILEFAMPGGSFLPGFVVGAVTDAELCFYPGAAPLRALVKANYGSLERPGTLLGAMSIQACCESFAARCAANPWTDRQPAALHTVTPVRDGESWCLRDETGALPAYENRQLLAVSGGHAVDVFGEWDGVRVTPLLVAKDRRLLRVVESLV